MPPGFATIMLAGGYGISVTAMSASVPAMLRLQISCMAPLAMHSRPTGYADEFCTDVFHC